jgi:hypothetical protein
MQSSLANDNQVSNGNRTELSGDFSDKLKKNLGPLLKAYLAHTSHSIAAVQSFMTNTFLKDSSIIPKERLDLKSAFLLCKEMIQDMGLGVDAIDSISKYGRCMVPRFSETNLFHPG